MCVIVQNFVAIRQTVADMTIFLFLAFQNDGRTVSWIYYVRAWTTNEDYLVVKIPIQYSRPQNGCRFEEFGHVNGEHLIAMYIVKIGPPVFAQLTVLYNPQILCFNNTFQWARHPAKSPLPVLGSGPPYTHGSFGSPKSTT